MPKLDLDALLYPIEGTQHEWSDVVEYFRDGEFDDEHYLVEAIEKYLLTEQQSNLIHSACLSIEKMLNGRYTQHHSALVWSIYYEWNQKLGFESFGRNS